MWEINYYRRRKYMEIVGAFYSSSFFHALERFCPLRTVLLLLFFDTQSRGSFVFFFSSTHARILDKHEYLDKYHTQKYGCCFAYGTATVIVEIRRYDKTQTGCDSRQRKAHACASNKLNIFPLLLFPQRQTSAILAPKNSHQHNSKSPSSYHHHAS